MLTEKNFETLDEGFRTFWNGLTEKSRFSSMELAEAAFYSGAVCMMYMADRDFRSVLDEHRGVVVEHIKSRQTDIA